MPDPEQLAQEIDSLLKPCGCDMQDKARSTSPPSRGVAVRELTFRTGEPDYSLCVNGKTIGMVEAESTSHSLAGVQ
jgi:type I site-specific restriction endonuclease